MTWYIVIMVLLFAAILLQKWGEKNYIDARMILLHHSIAILTFFMAFRSMNVGVDTKYYSLAFSEIANMNFSEAMTSPIYVVTSGTVIFDFEPGYRLLNYFISRFTSDYQAIVIINSLILMLLVYKLSCHQSPNPLLSVWIFLTLGFYQTGMNITRNLIAVFIIYLAIPYIEMQKPGRFVVMVLLAMSFHSSVIVLLPLPFLVKKFRVNRWNGFVLVMISVITGFALPRIGTNLMSILPERYAKYILSQNTKIEAIVLVVFYFFIIAFVYSLLDYNDKIIIRDKYNCEKWLFLLTLASYGLGISNKMGGRVASIFAPYLIIFIPELISEISDHWRKKNVENITIIICGIQYIFRMSINNIGGSLPYSFFWN